MDSYLLAGCDLCSSSMETSSASSNNSFLYDSHVVSKLASTVFRNTYDGHFANDSRILQSIHMFTSTIANDRKLMHNLGSSLAVSEVEHISCNPGSNARFGFKFLNDKEAEEGSRRIFARCEVCLVPLKSLKINKSGNKNPLLNWITI